MKCHLLPLVFIPLCLVLGGCSPQGGGAGAQGGAEQAASPTATEGTLRVMVTTSVIAEFVRAVGEGRVTVQELVPAGGDAHTFAPSPAGVRALARSRVLFANGAGLEGWLDQASAAAPDVPVVQLTDGLALREGDGDGSSPAEGQAGDSHAEDGHTGDDHAGHGNHDPHAWWDADLVAGYLSGVAETLGQLDPAGAETYRRNAQAYADQVREVDAYGREQFATIDPAQRRAVTVHGGLNYFAARYGLDIAGAVMPGLSTEREPSARDLVALTTQMRAQNVRVILTENVMGDRLAQALAQETGAVVAAPLYTDALGPVGTAGATYLGAFRHNIDSVVSALRATAP